MLATNHESRSGIHAFSLIEVVIALIVFSLGIVGVFNITSFLSVSSGRSMMKTEESMLIHHAVSAINLYISTKINPNTFNWSKVYDNFSGWRLLTPSAKYWYRIEPTETVGYDTYLREFVIQLRTPYRGNDVERKFVTYISR